EFSILKQKEVFFFQAEDGIRDFHVTGVQTCALPISGALESSGASMYRKLRRLPRRPELAKSFTDAVSEALADLVAHAGMAGDVRSEERRVGKKKLYKK